MNEETSDRLANLSADALEHLSEWLQATEVFVAEQAPLVAQEIIQWGIVKASLTIAFGVLATALTIVCASVLCKQWRRERTDSTLDDTALLLGGTKVVAAAVLCTVSVPIIGIGITSLCYVLTAPRLYILEQLSKLM